MKDINLKDHVRKQFYRRNMYIQGRYYPSIERLEDLEYTLQQITKDIYDDAQSKFNILEWMIDDKENKLKEAMYQILLDVSIQDITKEEFITLLDNKIRSLQ